MIIPTLHINEQDDVCVHLIDPYFPHEPYAILQMENIDDTIDIFFNLLIMALENHNDGYNDAMEDMEGGELDVEV